MQNALLPEGPRIWRGTGPTQVLTLTWRTIDQNFSRGLVVPPSVGSTLPQILHLAVVWLTLVKKCGIHSLFHHIVNVQSVLSISVSLKRVDQRSRVKDSIRDSSSTELHESAKNKVQMKLWHNQNQNRNIVNLRHILTGNKVNRVIWFLLQ